MDLETQAPDSCFNEAAAFHRTSTPDPARFNEAAALHRGKLGRPLDVLRDLQLASMRPRHYTAENQEYCQGHLWQLKRFNEAAALHRGKHHRADDLRSTHRGFNEAAALHRGKLSRVALLGGGFSPLQ